jgi:hypothetical protein
VDEHVYTRGNNEGTLVEIPELSADERLRPKLPPGGTPRANATLIGEGGSADVYVTHDDLPADVRARIAKIPDEKTKQEVRKAWAKAHANPRAYKVLKLKYGEAYTTARSVSRLEYLYEIAKDMTANAKVDGRPLVRVADTRFNTADLAAGLVDQEFINGPTAYELQRAVNLLRNPPKLAPNAVASAKAVLDAAGLSVDEAQRMIWCLEQFYRDSHGAALNAQREKSFGVSNGGKSDSPDKSGLSLEVGFDYLHGRNVVWDAKTRMFVLVDW